jgi:hypothetical protein
MRAVFMKAGAKTSFSEPGVVAVQLDTSEAARLLEPSLRAAVDAATRDIVTAAGLALTDSAN